MCVYNFRQTFGQKCTVYFEVCLLCLDLLHRCCRNFWFTISSKPSSIDLSSNENEPTLSLLSRADFVIGAVHLWGGVFWWGTACILVHNGIRLVTLNLATSCYTHPRGETGVELHIWHWLLLTGRLLSSAVWGGLLWAGCLWEEKTTFSCFWKQTQDSHYSSLLFCPLALHFLSPFPSHYFVFWSWEEHESSGQCGEGQC